MKTRLANHLKKDPTFLTTKSANELTTLLCLDLRTAVNVKKEVVFSGESWNLVKKKIITWGLSVVEQWFAKHVQPFYETASRFYYAQKVGLFVEKPKTHWYPAAAQEVGDLIQISAEVLGFLWHVYERKYETRLQVFLNPPWENVDSSEDSVSSEEISSEEMEEATEE